MFFKIESWNFQHLLKKNFLKPLEISTQSVEILWGFKVFFSNRCRKFQLSILKTNKVLFQKNIIKAVVSKKTKRVPAVSIFREGFELHILVPCYHSTSAEFLLLQFCLIRYLPGYLLRICSTQSGDVYTKSHCFFFPSAQILRIDLRNSTWRIAEARSPIRYLSAVFFLIFI